MERVHGMELRRVSRPRLTGMITLTLKEEPTRPARGREHLARRDGHLDHAAIRALPVFLGKQQRRLDDFFEVEGEASDELEIRGDSAGSSGSAAA